MGVFRLGVACRGAELRVVRTRVKFGALARVYAVHEGGVDGTTQLSWPVITDLSRRGLVFGVALTPRE